MEPSATPDAESRQLLEEHRAAGRPPIFEQRLEEARSALRLARADPPLHSDLVTATDFALPGPGGPVAVRVYRPAGTVGPLPVLVYFHGGSWVVGDLDSHDDDCRSLCALAGCAVVSVDYRLAPEHRFPAPVEDGFAVVSWLATDGASLGVDPARVAVGGVSAGGNIAAAVALAARDRGSPPLTFQLLVYPITDCGLDTPSFEEFGEGHLPTRASMRWCWEQYAPTPEDRRHPYASPLRAPSLAGLPPALVVTAGCDPLRDEGEAYGRRLREAGVPCEVSRYEGAVHTFFSLARRLETARRAHREAAEHLIASFARPISATAGPVG